MSGGNGGVKRKANTTEDWRENVKHVTTPERNYYRYMLEHGIFTDCTFVVGPEGGETCEFKAHRLHIARLSPVFEAMLLRGEMVEAKTGHVRVTDLSPNTFQLLLSSIYGKKPEMTCFQEAQDLAFAANKYQIKLLLEICVARLIALIAPVHIWAAFETSDLLQEENIKKTCIQFLQLNTLQCITNPATFLQATEENVVLLLEQDELNVEDELDLVNVVVHWARHEARRRGLTGDDEGVRAVLEPRLLPLLRFLTLKPHQFLTGPGLAGWLTSEEKAAINECLRTKDFSKVPQNLSCVPRKRKNKIPMASTILTQGKEPSGNFICERKILNSRPNVEQRDDIECCISNLRKNLIEHYKCVHATLLFRAKSGCQLLGFQCASRCKTDSTLLTTPTYIENIVATVYTFNRCLSSDHQKISFGHVLHYGETEYDSTISVMFSKPLSIVLDHWYTIDLVYRHHEGDGQPGEYPNPERARNITDAEGRLRFEFIKEIDHCDGTFESLIFAL